MKFSVKTSVSIRIIGRTIGYHLLGEQGGEFNFARPLSGNNYPRFHMYAMARPGEIVANLHLDQKRPSYEGTTAHSGEYEGKFIEEEATRIRDALTQNKSQLSLDVSDY